MYYKTKKLISLILILMFLFSFTGCKKTVPYIKPEKLISVIEEDFDIEESSDYEENSFHVSRRDISSECINTNINHSSTISKPINVIVILWWKVSIQSSNL